MRIVQCGLHWACVERGGKVLDGKTIDGIFLDLYLASVLLSYKQYRTHNLIKESESAYCLPSNPQHELTEIATYCYAHNTGLIQSKHQVAIPVVPNCG